MSAFQVTSFVGIPVTVLVVAIVLIAFARPDGDDGVYAAYLSLATILSLYVLLVSLAGLAESITRELAVGDTNISSIDGQIISPLVSLVSGEDAGSAIAAFATVAVLMTGSLTFHERRRAELRSTVVGRSCVPRIDRAHCAAVCFTMVSVAAAAGFVAGMAGYSFFHHPVASAGDQARDISVGVLLGYGGLVLVAGLIFRANVWAIRGNDETPEAVAPTELGDA